MDNIEYLLQKTFFFLAVFLWMSTLIIHLLAISHYYFAAIVQLENLLAISLFLICPVAIIWSNNRYRTRGKKVEHIESFFYPYNEVSRWILIPALICFVYMSVNFWLSASGCTPEVSGNQFLLMEKSRFIRYLTQEEYHQYILKDIRLGTGHYLAFYGIASVLLAYVCKKHKSSLEQLNMTEVFKMNR
jgi:hypothetical protein